MAIPLNKLIYTLHSSSAGDRVVTPTGESVLKIKIDRHDSPEDPCFDYFFTVDGKLTFKDDDFHWLLDILQAGNRCELITIEMNDKRCIGSPDIFPGATIKLSEGEYNLDKCTVTIPISTPDKYESYNANKSDELNIFDASFTRVGPNFLDPTIGFYFNTSTYESPEFPYLAGPGDPSSQIYDYFPNLNCEYPGFGIDGEEFTDPAATPTDLYTDTGGILFLANHATTGRPKLHDGANPYHSGYASAALAQAQGWRLCYAKYQIMSTASFQQKFVGLWIWCRMQKRIPAGSPALPGWIYDSTSLGEDIYYRPPIMNVRSRGDGFGTPPEGFFRSGVSGGASNIPFYIDKPFNATVVDDTPQFSAEMINNIVGFEPLTPSGPYVFGLLALPENGVLLNDIITAAVAHADPTLTVKSDFLQIDPWTVSANNPITGQPSTTDNIIVFQKSDVKRPFDSGRATVGMYTPESLMQWLMLQMKLKYRIIDGVFMIEHKTSALFVHATVLDLTVPPLDKFLAGTRAFTFDQIDLPAKETFRWMESKPITATAGPGLYDDFSGAPILYDGQCVDRGRDTGVKQYVAERITNDVEYIISLPVANKNAVSDDGFVFISTIIDGGTYYINTKSIILGVIERMNNVMGWAYLHDMFYRSDANAASGEMNTLPITFDSTKYIKRSGDLKFIQCCFAEFDAYATMISALGEGVIQTAEFEVGSGLMVVKLGFRD